MKELHKTKEGSFAVFITLFIPAVIFLFFVLFGRGEMLIIKTNIKAVMDIAIETATDNAMVMQDGTSSDQFCVILNTTSGRNKTYEMVTDLFEENLNATYGSKLGTELRIVQIGTTTDSNSWGWNEASQSFSNISADLKRTFKQGRSDMIVEGYYRPFYLSAMPSSWEGFHFVITSYGSCSITER